MIIGIDEAGRGPLAGPVAVGIFAFEKKMEKRILREIFDGKLRDSKKLSPKKREEIFKKFQTLKQNRGVFWSVLQVSNKQIDRLGISKCVSGAIAKLLSDLSSIRRSSLGLYFDIRLDGLLKAPAEYRSAGWRTKTIIKGDEKEVAIACASIVAKVLRDRTMCRLAKKFPLYSFQIHKGYGTLLHRSAILKNGLSSLHRTTYCKNIRLP